MTGCWISAWFDGSDRVEGCSTYRVRVLEINYRNHRRSKKSMKTIAKSDSDAKDIMDLDTIRLSKSQQAPASGVIVTAC